MKLKPLASRASRASRACLAATLALLAGCSTEPAPTPAPLPQACPADDGTGIPLLGNDCDPLVPTQCGFPFPSNVYLIDDPYSHTGKRVAFGRTTLPQFSQGSHLDPLWWKNSDGFSPGQTILTHLPGATITGLPTQDTLDASIKTDSPTILLDADTGELVPHFSEIDQSIYNEDDVDRAFMIRPVVRLKDSARYIVAIRHVVDVNGKAIDPTPAWKALRDGEASCDPAVTRRRALYDDIFARLDKAGIKKDDLQIAWDYSTASRENNTSRFLRMRDDALDKVGSGGPDYTIAGIEENPNPHIRRRIHVMMNAPLYLNQPGVGGRLLLDEDGMPLQNGTAPYEVLVQIPNAATKGTPGALLQNGHGLFGAKTEGQDGYLAEICDKWNYVSLAVDLVGMSHEDFPLIANSISSDIYGFVASVDRQHQGILNSLLAMRLLKGNFANDPATIIDGNKTIDPSHVYYRGDSQGGIFGTTYMAVSTDVTRGLLGEPGLPYSLLLNRSADFGAYFILLHNSFRSGRNVEMVLGLLQMIWDRTEPDGYVPYINGGLPNTPKHDVLIHAAIGDHQVTPLGAHIIARTVGAKNLSPVNRPIWGVPEDPGPFMGSGIVEFSFGLKPSPTTDTPPDDTFGPDPHDTVRTEPFAIDQSNEFFRTGVIRAYCAGPCDPE